MINGRILISLFILLIAGCSEKNPEQSLSGVVDQRSESDKNYLAYEHTAIVDLAPAVMESTFRTVIDECLKETQYLCTVLDSEISNGEYASASVRMRLKPIGVEEFIALAASNGSITRRSTHVEDLAEPIIESDRKLAMLENYLENLMKLQAESEGNIDSLIKVTSEIAATESKIDVLKGEHAYLRQRVELDILSIQFVVKRSRSFWAPIKFSLDDFGDELSEGISGAIIGFAYLLPWLFILVPLIFIIRYIWRRVG